MSYYQAALMAMGLTVSDIKILDKDGLLKDRPMLRDLIMGLYYRAKRSEKKVEDLLDVHKETNLHALNMAVAAFALGVSLTVIVYNCN